MLPKDYENLALKIYLNKGYKLIAKNYRGRNFEVDLILQSPKEILILEVKASYWDSDLVAHKFIAKQIKIYLRFLSKIENSKLSTYNLSFKLIIFAKNSGKRLRFKQYKIF